jgi:hypothetical protein
MQRAHGRDGCGDLEAATEVELQALRTELTDNDSLKAGLTKLLLAGSSAALAWGVVWVTCVWQLGSHSLGGWVLSVLLLAWRVVVWLWRLLVWRPPSWYPVQVRSNREPDGIRINCIALEMAWETAPAAFGCQ